MNSSTKTFLNKAKEFHKTALKEFMEANGNDVKIRQAGEKGWIAVVQATNALFEKKGIKIPRGTRQRENILLDLEKKDPKIAKENILDKYRNFLYGLHVDCFYDGTYSIKLVERDLRKVENYMQTIEKL